MSKKGLQFKVIIEEGKDGYLIASVPSLPGCYTQAKTLPTLKKRIREAILLCLEVAKEDPVYREQIKSLAYEPSFVGVETIQV